jgi:hypothetical protein
MQYVDSNGEKSYWTRWLVKKSAFDDGSYKQHPEAAYEIQDIEEHSAFKPFDEDAPEMKIETLIFRDGYVVVDELDFDRDAMRRERSLRHKRRREKDKTIYLKQKRQFEERNNKKVKQSWWSRLFS